MARRSGGVTLMGGGRRGIGNELVTKPKGKHTQQNSKNRGQNEVNDPAAAEWNRQ
jgi:hypothetical protein